MANVNRDLARLREAAVLRFFRDHPKATIEACQEALSMGALTGEPGPTMSKQTICRLRRQATLEATALPSPQTPAADAGEEFVFTLTVRFPRSTTPGELAEFVRAVRDAGSKASS